MDKLKKNWSLAVVILATVVLAVIAVVTALKLYRFGKQPVAPTAPRPAPAVEPACRKTFTVSVPSITPTLTVTPTLTPSPTLTLTPTTTPRVTPTPTPQLGCFKECVSDDTCEGDLRCLDYSGTKRCLNPSCQTERDCVCNKNCWDVCGHDNECPSGLSCKQIGETKRCVNLSCEREQDCDCVPPRGASPTPTPTVVKVELPEAGFTLPTAGAILGGALLVIISLLLAL